VAYEYDTLVYREIKTSPRIAPGSDAVRGFFNEDYE
jgi:hypothetical protein